MFMEYCWIAKELGPQVSDGCTFSEHSTYSHSQVCACSGVCYDWICHVTCVSKERGNTYICFAIKWYDMYCLGYIFAGIRLWKVCKF